MSTAPLGILASSGGGAASYELIETRLLSSNATSVTFSSIPATFTHLQIRATVRSDRSFGVDNLGLRFNSDTGSNYNAHFLFNNGSTITSTDLGINTAIYAARITDASVTANSFGATIIDVLDYASTSKQKTIRSAYASSTTGSYPWNGMHSGIWLSTSAVTGLTLLPIAGTNLVSGSRISLYGIKGA